MLKNSLLMLFSFSLVACNTVTENVKKTPEPNKTASISIKKQIKPAVEKVMVSTNSAEFNGDVLYKLLSAEIAGRRGLMDFALAEYLEVSEQLKSPAVAERATTIADYKHDDMAIEKTAKRWLELSPENVDALKTLFSVSLRKNNLQQAKEYGNKIIEFSKNKTMARKIIAATIILEKNTKIAIPITQALVKSYPNSADLYFVLSKLYYEKVQRIPSLKAINKVLKLDPTRIDAYIIKSALLYEQKDGSAIKFLESAIQNHPKSKKLRLAIVRFLIDSGQTKQSRKHLESIYQNAYNDVKTIFNIALLAVESEQYGVAKKYLKRTIDLGQYLNSSYYYLGRIASKENQHQQAVEYYALVASGAHLSEASFRIVESLVILNKIPEALEHIKTLGKSFPPEGKKKLELDLFEAQLLRSVGNYQASYDLLNKSLQYHPNNIEILYSKALSADRLGKYHEFEVDLKKILKNFPNNAQALNALAYYLVSKTQRLDEAEAYVKKAYKINDTDPAIIDTVGWLYFKRGQIKEAELWLTRANALVFDPEIAAHMAEILWVRGKFVESKALFKKALKRFPANVELKETIKRLKVSF